MTPHINANKKDVAKVVLMPGDPLRAKWIAETFLTDVKQINSIRNMLGYTGLFKNTKVTIMAHGMGNPSVGIYSHELMANNFYDVDTIIRIGSCGSLDKNVKVRDLIIAKTAFSESSYAKWVGVEVKDQILHANLELVQLATKTASELKITPHLSQVYASDVFYSIETPEQTRIRTQSAVVEMEAFALYANAIRNKKKALCLLTVSDSLITHESMPAIERQTSFTEMVLLALNMAVQLLK